MVVFTVTQSTKTLTSPPPPPLPKNDKYDTTTNVPIDSIGRTLLHFSNEAHGVIVQQISIINIVDKFMPFELMLVSAEISCIFFFSSLLSSSIKVIQTPSSLLQVKRSESNVITTKYQEHALVICRCHKYRTYKSLN